MGPRGIETGPGAAQAAAEHDMTGAAYTIDDILDDLTSAYFITPKDRRSGQRHGPAARRRGEDQNS